MTAVIISNEVMGDIIKVVKSPEKSGFTNERYWGNN